MFDKVSILPRNKNIILNLKFEQIIGSKSIKIIN